MKAAYRWGGTALGLGLAVLLGVAGLHYLEAEALIRSHYPLQSVAPHSVTAAKAVARGAHLSRIFGCADCHGADLRGRMVERAGAAVFAPGLRALPSAYSDGDIVRAVRFGLNPDGTSLWLMPSASYVYLSTADMDALIAYLRRLPRETAAVRPPRFGHAARDAIRTGKIAPAAAKVESVVSPMDLGPHYEGGRYLARAACAECHGLDLAGSVDGRVPGLKSVGYYNLQQFFALMHDGRDRHGAHTPVMSHLAGERFRYFADYETRALYDYLWTRAKMTEVTLH